MQSQPIDFRHTVVAKHPERLSQIRYLLADSGLGTDNDITLFVEAWSGAQLVGCAGLAANVIKCVAVNEQLRGGKPQRASAGRGGKRGAGARPFSPLPLHPSVQ